MRTLLYVLAVVLFTSNSFGQNLVINQKKLDNLYAEETPQKRSDSLLNNLVADIANQLKTSLPDSTKNHVIRQTLNAWRGKKYIPIISLGWVEGHLMRDTLYLRSVMDIVQKVITLWPQKNNWDEAELEIYFDNMIMRARYIGEYVDYLMQAFPQDKYPALECSIKETFAINNKYLYRPCASITIKL